MDIIDFSKREERFLACYVQNNNDYYWEKWRGRDPRTPFTSWNWAAFFFGAEWMLYRKMYGEAIAIVILRLILAFIIPYLYLIATIIIGICVGLYGNYIYFQKAHREAGSVQGLDQRSAEALLNKRGGVNIALVIAIEVISLLLQFFA